MKGNTNNYYTRKVFNYPRKVIILRGRFLIICRRNSPRKVFNCPGKIYNYLRKVFNYPRKVYLLMRVMANHKQLGLSVTLSVRDSHMYTPLN